MIVLAGIRIVGHDARTKHFRRENPGASQVAIIAIIDCFAIRTGFCPVKVPIGFGCCNDITAIICFAAVEVTPLFCSFIELRRIQGVVSLFFKLKRFNMIDRIFRERHSHALNQERLFVDGESFSRLEFGERNLEVLSCSGKYIRLGF